MSEMTQLETLRAQLAELKAEVEKKKAEVEAAENNEKPFHGFANLYASEDGSRRCEGSYPTREKAIAGHSETAYLRYLRTIEIQEVIPGQTPLVEV